MREALLERVQGLATRFSWLGIGPDLAALPFAAPSGVYRLLLRMANG